ncbi:dopamine beta-hydroxylase-like [Physella acuta]|uniref:dopamine beta-hydroxylase-like n=1 Tax=Physella acuta TaxID=109671 RepID=UPI0027DC8275|nr:dopamine beta-hydroxylase-like [Physella acuta]
MNIVEIVCVLAVLTECVLFTSGDDDTVCEETKHADVKYFDIRLPYMNVPENLTSYVCDLQRIPIALDVPYHAVAFEPIIINHDVMHHMILFGCEQEQEYIAPHHCGPVDNVCRTFLVQWSMGIRGQICSYPGTGVRFGAGSLKSLSLQIHWNNANQRPGLTDSSGVRVYYTTRLKENDLGNIQIGQNDLTIQPGVIRTLVTGSCSSACTRLWIQEPIYLTRGHIHMHYLGDGGRLELIRGGKAIQVVIDDISFDYHSPPAHYFDDPVQVLPGDELKVTCYFNSRDGAKARNRTVYWGEGSDGEMCYAFLTYFPKVDNFDQCIQFDKYDICSPSGTALLGDCSFGGFQNYFSTVMADDIIRNCASGGQVYDQTKLCTINCQRALQDFKENPCMEDRLGKYAIRVYLSGVPTWPQVAKILDAAEKYCLD